jgi:ABC-type spermidine/putrescine transport system permease subunit I
LINSFGRTLSFLFFVGVAFWGLILIAGPTLLLLDKSFTSPPYKLQSAVITNSITELDTCILLLSIEEHGSLQCERAGVSTLQGANSAKAQKEQELLRALEEEASGNPYTLSNYTELFDRNLTIRVMATTVLYAIAATALCLVIAYPVAYNMSVVSGRTAAIWVFTALIVPYCTAEVIRIYSWLSVFDKDGFINSILQWFGLSPLLFIKAPLTVFVVIVHTFMLFMVFPIYNAMQSLDKRQIFAARGLGASWVQTHRHVIIPHAKTGIAVGCVAVFALSTTTLSIPRIISRGLQGDWFSQTIYTKFFEGSGANTGAAYAAVFTVVCIGAIASFMWATKTKLKDFASE